MISPTLIPTSMPHGYNASITTHRGMRLMSYRYHPNPEQWRTQMMIQEWHENHVQEYQLRLPDEYAEMSHEDGRFFYFNGLLCLSLTVAVFPGVINAPPPCVTVYGMLEKNGDFYELKHVVKPKFGDNNWQGQSKNNVFFEHQGKLYQIYQCSPEQVVIRLKEDGSAEEVFRSESPAWEHGELRGGTQPLPFGDKWLRFFHSLHKHGNNRNDWTYCIGAMVQNPNPPFQIERISKYPIFSGDERFVPHWRYCKPSVSIPYGAIEDGDGWTVGVGLNDSFCATLNVTTQDLRL